MRLLGEFSYKTLITLFQLHKPASDPPIPESWLSTINSGDDSVFEQALTGLLEQYLDSVFNNATKFSKEEFIENLRSKSKEWLQPHYIRQ